jgi:hypothetical protein
MGEGARLTNEQREALGRIHGAAWGIFALADEVERATKSGNLIGLDELVRLSINMRREAAEIECNRDVIERSLP